MEIFIRNNSIVRISPENTPPHKKNQLFSDSQRDFLIQFYDNTEHYPIPEEYELFAARFNISKPRVKTWFKNRRARHKARRRVLPVKTASEPWSFPATTTKHEYHPPPPPILKLNTRDFWVFWKSTSQDDVIRATNAILCQNPHTFQIQACHQQPPTFQGQGFIPCDLYEAQAWWKKKRAWETRWKKIAEL